MSAALVHTLLHKGRVAQASTSVNTTLAANPHLAPTLAATAGRVNAYDLILNPGGPPNTMHPGVVVNLPELKLAPESGPECSTEITGTKNSLAIGTGAELILSMMIAQ